MASGMSIHGLGEEAEKGRSPVEDFNLERGITNKVILDDCKVLVGL